MDFIVGNKVCGCDNTNNRFGVVKGMLVVETTCLVDMRNWRNVVEGMVIVDMLDSGDPCQGMDMIDMICVCDIVGNTMRVYVFNSARKWRVSVNVLDTMGVYVICRRDSVDVVVILSIRMVRTSMVVIRMVRIPMVVIRMVVMRRTSRDFVDVAIGVVAVVPNRGR